MRIRKRLILFSMVVCLISILLISLINYLISIKELEREVNLNNQSFANIIAKELDKWIAIQIESLIETSDSIAYNEKNYEGIILKDI
ncbi:MAG TPA: hypothetical protein VK071_08810 [Tissierellales bacterium]|nr:hypothetical protein [Tissierellales bacterium]